MSVRVHETDCVCVCCPLDTESGGAQSSKIGRESQCVGFQLKEVKVLIRRRALQKKKKKKKRTLLLLSSGTEMSAEML